MARPLGRDWPGAGEKVTGKFMKLTTVPNWVGRRRGDRVGGGMCEVAG